MDFDAFDYVALRRAIHSQPELGYHEFETTKKIKDFLTAKGMEFHSFNGLTGGFVCIDAGKEKTVCLRADIDALPLSEDTNAEFASTTPQIMHACGHDMHTAIAVGTACELYRRKDQMPCNVVVLFQPAEECNPNSGARAVVKTGFLDEQNISEIYGLHLWPALPVGDIAVKAGPIMGASDRLRIEVTGRTAHAAEPHLGVDAIAIAAQIDCALVQNLRKEVDSFDPISVSIGSFKTSGRYNIVCDHAVLEGTLRTVTETTRAFLHRRIQEVAEGIAVTYGGTATVEIGKGYPVVNNSPELYSRFAAFAQKAMGAEHVHTDIHSSLIAEDFSFYGRCRPALYFHLGCQAQYPLHSNRFLPDERAIKVAICLMSEYFLDMK